MNQALTIKLPMKPNKKQQQLLKEQSQEYIDCVNELVHQMVLIKHRIDYTSKDVLFYLNSSIKNQAIRDAKSVFQKIKKNSFKIIPFLKKPVFICNNQNWQLKDNKISFPVMIDGKSCRLKIKVNLSSYHKKLLKKTSKLGTLRITQINHYWVAQIAIEKNIWNHQSNKTKKVMGIDLGIKVPAVAYTEDGKIQFFGKGRQNKQIRRKFNSLRVYLGKQKKLNVIKQINNKEQRWMRNQDHQISREIINYALKNHINVIQLEALSGIRETTRTSRKNNYSLSNWSFYRLSQYIEYKANLVGIQVNYVNPAYTSQLCPCCGKKNKAIDRNYHCSDCDYLTHRDIVGAINIMKSPV